MFLIIFFGKLVLYQSLFIVEVLR